ncbi:MAG: hypothetical protein ACTHNP_11115 [Solirubrobacterales bacterium]
MTDRKETEEFERGYRAAQLERLGPKGITRSRLLPGAEYRFRDGHFQSAVRYECDVMENLRHLQRLRRDDPTSEDLRQLEEEVKSELRLARSSVDALRREAIGRSEVVKAMRALPQRPGTALEYASFIEAVEDDPGRALPDWPAREDLGGADFGTRWSLENPIRRWETTRWRISWLCETTNEVYAIEFKSQTGPRQLGRVWILGQLTSWDAARRALEDLSLRAMDYRNSLIVAAEAVARVAREEQADGQL